MEKEVMEKYLKAGRICAEAKIVVARKIAVGMNLLEVAELVERFIRQQGAKPAFPVNVSINEIAAHYTPKMGETRVIKEGDVVKVDVGAQVDGYIGDTALTWCSEKSELAACAEGALKEAVRVVKPGADISEIGKTIQVFVEGKGFGLIVNLTGHALDQNIFHGSPSIPNTETNSRGVLEEDMVIAIEPFVAETNAQVRESGDAEIFRLLQPRPVRMAEARAILSQAGKEFTVFPFAKRWLSVPQVRASLALNQLMQTGAVESYPPLKDFGGRKIAQAEHTIIVRDKPVVTTSLSD